MKGKKTEEGIEKFRESLKKIDKKDFDGHTHFASLSVRQKLTWLSELNYFKYFIKKNKEKKR